MSNWQRWKNIMKAYPFEEKRLNKWEPPYIVQPKYDGVRCRAIPTESGYLLLSSEENVIYSVPHINSALNKSGLQNEFDGELYLHGLPFESIVSITSRTINLHPNYQNIQFHIFDIINEDIQGVRITTYRNIDFKEPLMKAPFWICENLDEIIRVYEALCEDGYEGIIVRHLLALYERKRSLYVMKFKPKQEDEYKIVGVQEEYDIYGQPKDRLGALVCESGDGNIFNVGTGFNDEQRKELWEISGLLPGMIAKVEYQHITSGKKVPRFPVFVEIIK